MPRHAAPVTIHSTDNIVIANVDDSACPYREWMTDASGHRKVMVEVLQVLEHARAPLIKQAFGEREAGMPRFVVNILT